VDHQIFKQDWLRQFDRELEPLQDILHEFQISFPPSYPFEEDPQLPHSYMSTRLFFLKKEMIHFSKKK
jgi:inositol-1,4,5-trisphosphate 5-phosphatase